jgi:aminoglycoside phosphotransferase (APT) family kinase protein
LPLVEVASGWDNVIYRLGDSLSVRLPRREAAATLIEHEQRWLPAMADRLPLPIPAPVRVGRRGSGYPWSWSVCPWLEGATAADEPPHDAFVTARQLGAFLLALHTPAPPDAPANPYRGVPLPDRAQATQGRIEQMSEAFDATEVQRCWIELAATPGWTGPPLWLHGDLHPLNVLVHEGRLSAVIDFGDLTAGDPAADLSVAWMLFDPSARRVFRAAVGSVDDDTWQRARGWAVSLALAYLASSGDSPTLARIGRETIAAALDDHEQ